MPCLAALVLAAASLVLPRPSMADDPWVHYPGGAGPGAGKKVVLVSGDEEYRSEEALTQLARILSKHHGFDCTVLYAIDPADGTVNPVVTNNIPGLEQLDDADLLVLFTRFRDLPPEQMAHIEKYVDAGKPIIGLRTSTHAFNFKPDHPYARWTWTSKEPDGGFGRMVLGETWVAHHGDHGKESTRGVIAPGQEANPILRGIEGPEIHGPTDVYTVTLPLPGDSTPLVLGQVLTGMDPTDPPLAGPKNDPMMPVAWTKTYTGPAGKTCRVFTTTMGASRDLLSEGLRRLLVNAAYWSVGLEDQIPAKAEVSIVGPYEPLPFGFGTHRKGLKPADMK